MDYPNLRKVKKILVIKLRSLGDVLLATPVFSILKQRLPHAEIDAYIYADAYDLLEGNPFISKIFVYDQKIKKKNFFIRIKKEFQLLKELRKQKYDLVMNLTEGDRGAVVSSVSDALIKVGIKENKTRESIYTHLAKIPGSPRHTVEKNLDYLRRIGIFPEEKEKQLYLPLLEDAKRKTLVELGRKGFETSQFIAIHSAARWDFKAWPAYRFERLSRMLVQRGEKLVFTASDKQKEMSKIEKIVQDLDPSSYLNLAGKITLPELAALIHYSKLLVTVDSLPLHMASALKKKTVALFGPTQEKLWGPWQNQEAKVLFEDYSCRPCCQEGCGGSKRCECLYTLKEERVLQAIEALEKGTKVVSGLEGQLKA